jgi:hypothetical protein
MKLNHKELIIGITIGSLLTSAPTIANVSKSVYEATVNSFKVKVNGVEQPLEGYNIGGYTYFKLRDIGEHVGFDVGFEDGTIMIDTGDEVDKVSSSDSGVEDSVEDDKPLGYWDIVDEYLHSKDYMIIEQGGVKYVEVPAVMDMVWKPSYVYNQLLSTRVCANSEYWWVQYGEEKVTEGYQAYMIGVTGYMTYEQFENIVQPIFNKELDECGIPR